MSIAPASISAAPFDAVAGSYDQTFTFSRIGRAQRAVVWKELEKTFRPGDRVLEIGCGTGVDACFLADHGVSVTACDSSPQMVAAATRRVTAEGKLSQVRPHLVAAEDVARLQSDSSFDGAFSNFGALNCVEDLAKFARDLGALLKPGATALFCFLGSCCLWEITWYLAKGNPDKAFRRFRREGVTAQLAAGDSVHVQYPSVRALARCFTPAFEIRSVHGVGVAVPPSYVEAWAMRFPRLLELSVRADSLLGRCPGIRTCADHVLVEFRRSNLPV
jgi:ubiquinone/menaquinone biosynthesis C-methylase UbiE